MTTPAGWYPDPDDPTSQRYHDGSDWTEQRMPAPTPVPPPPPPPLGMPGGMAGVPTSPPAQVGNLLSIIGMVIGASLAVNST